MGMIKKLKSPNRVLVCFDGDELIETKIGLYTDEFHNFGHHLWHIAVQKLQEKKVNIPQGAVKICFDKPTGQYHILFMEPGDLGE